MGEVGMQLERLTEVVDELAAVVPDAMAVEEVGVVLAGVDRQIARLEGVKAKLAASFARRDGYRVSGHKSLQHWLQAALRKAPGQARREANTAHRLDTDLADTRRALADGDISLEHAAAIADAATQLGDAQAAERSLLAQARRADPAQVKKSGRRLAQQSDRQAATAAARRAYARRGLRFWSDRDGTVWFEGRAHQLGGEYVMAAVNALAAPTAKDDQRTPDQRRLDGLVELSRTYLQDGVAPREGGAPAELVVVVPVEEIEQRAGAPPGTLAWTGPCPPPALNQLVCEAGLSWLITDPTGLPLQLGKTRRFASRHQRRALHARDGGCRWPACSARAEWSIAHHEPPYDHPHGRTDLDRLVLLCAFHHNLRHHADWTLTLHPDATVTATSPDGTTVLRETAQQARARHHHGTNPDKLHINADDRSAPVACTATPATVAIAPRAGVTAPGCPRRGREVRSSARAAAGPSRRRGRAGPAGRRGQGGRHPPADRHPDVRRRCPPAARRAPRGPPPD